jgi:pimeloyl-ACP methyl ester carboxylesterase
MYIEDAGHFPMLERPEAFNELLKQAIDSIEEKGSKPI